MSAPFDESSVFIHPNLKLMSFNNCETQYQCPRKFACDRLVNPENYGEDLNGDEHTSFGKLVGTSVQEYFTTGSRNSAFIKALTIWNDFIDSDAGARDRKTFWHGLHAIEVFDSVRKNVFRDYELVSIDSKPATELGFKIACGYGFQYRGFIDIVLMHKKTKALVPIELKTTKYREIPPAMYGNSDQALGYGIMLDLLASKLGLPKQEEFKVYYPIYSTSKMEWEVLEFEKTQVERALWIKNILEARDDRIRWAKNNYYPMRGNACFSYGRECEWFGTCNVSEEYLFGDLSKIANIVDDERKYTYHFNLEDIISNQLEGV